MMKITLAVAAATTATIGTVAGGTTPAPQLASARAVSPSAHDSAAAWRLPRLNGTTAAGSRARSVAATKRRAGLVLCLFSVLVPGIIAG